MKSKTILLIVALLLVLGSGMACSKKEPAEEADARTEKAAETIVAKAATTVDEPTKKAKDTPEPEADEEEEEESIELRSTNELDSYREKTKWYFGVADDEPEGNEMLVEYVRATSARRTVHTVKLPSGETVTSEFIQIGDTSYMGVGEEWVAMQSSEAEDASDELIGWADPASFIEDCNYKGKETITGLATKHYQCDENALIGSQSKMFATASQVRIEEGSIDVWISTQHNIAVKMIWEWKGKDPDGKAFHWKMESEIYDINKPITIEKPEGAQEAGLPDDIPLIEGATDVNAIGLMVTFKSPLPQDDVIAYYKEQMAKNGWEMQESVIPMMMSFTKGDRRAQVMVGEGDAPDVSIVVQEE